MLPMSYILDMRAKKRAERREPGVAWIRTLHEQIDASLLYACSFGSNGTTVKLPGYFEYCQVHELGGDYFANYCNAVKIEVETYRASGYEVTVHVVDDKIKFLRECAVTVALPAPEESVKEFDNA